MQTRSSDENSVCPSVKRVHCDKTEESFSQYMNYGDIVRGFWAHIS